MNTSETPTKDNVLRRTIHLRERLNGVVQPTGGATVTCDYDKDTKQLRFAVALCSTKDGFCKKKGRLISQGRLVTGFVADDPYTMIAGHRFVFRATVPENVRFVNVIYDTIQDVLKNDKWIKEPDVSNLEDIAYLCEDTIHYTTQKYTEENLLTQPIDY